MHTYPALAVNRPVPRFVHRFMQRGSQMKYRVLLVLLASLVGSASAEIPLSYVLPEAGQVSIVIWNADGIVVRELLHAAPRDKGKNVERWDGLDERGRPVPAGEYSWKLLLTQGLKAQYILTLGTNPTPRLDTWPGNHCGARSVAVDDTGMYVSGGCGEGAILALKQTLDGKRIWTIPHWFEAWCGGHALASAGGKLFLMHQTGRTPVIDAAAGKRLTTWDLFWPGDDGKTDDEARKEVPKTIDLDAGGDQIVVSYTKHNAIRWLNPADGTVLNEAAVEAPLGIAVDPNGNRVLVISKGKIVAVTRQAKTPAPVVTADLVEPWRLDVDDKTGDIFVVDRGTCQQVKRFSKDGKLLKAYGVPGGRPPFGPYDPNKFTEMEDIAADQTGGFIIVENRAPRRTARFDAGGKLVREWYGGQHYANAAVLYPNDPTTAIVYTAWVLMKVKIDWQTQTWKVDRIYEYVEGGSQCEIRFHNGQAYACGTSMSPPRVSRIDDAACKLVQVADLSKTPGVYGWSAGKGFTYFGHDEAKVYRFDVKEWTDDGVPVYPDKGEVAGEIPEWERPLGSGRGFNALAEGDDGDVYFAENGGKNPLYGFGWWGSHTGGNRVLKWDKTGRLQWAVGRHAAGSAEPVIVRPTSVNAVQHALGIEAGPGEGRHFWGPAGAVRGCVVVRDVESPMHVWDKDGLWVGRLLEDPDLTEAPADAYTMGCENFGGTFHIVSADANVPGLKRGDVLFVASGRNNNPIHRITGWDQFKRQSGTVAVSEKQARSVAEAVRKDRERPDVVHVPHFNRITDVNPHQRTTMVDGELKEWANVKPLEIKEGGKVRARLYLAWGTIIPSHNGVHGLYAAFDVTADTPWKSSAAPEHAFEGASVELRYGPLQPRRKEPAVGDIRVVAAPIGPDGKTVTMEFMPKLAFGWPGSTRKPFTFDSEGRKLAFDRVAPIRDGWHETGRPLVDGGLEFLTPVVKPRADGTGYVVEMLIPMRAPLYVKPGLRFLLDASIVLPGPGGQTLRLPWHSTDKADKKTGDTAVECQLRPRNWAEAELDFE